MAVRLRDVAASEHEQADPTAGWEDALKPSTRIMGGRIADKLGSRMGLRLSDERFLPDQHGVTLFEEQSEPRTHMFGWPTVPIAHA